MGEVSSKKLLVILIIFLFVNVSLPAEVAVGFGKLTSDKDILNLLEKCNGKLKRLWYSTPYGGGGSSTHREAKNNSEFVSISRKKITKMLGKYGYVMTGINLQIALEYTEFKDIMSSKKLKKYITGLLNSFYLQKLSYEYVASAHPIYFAMLVEINSEDIKCLEKNKLVKDMGVDDSPSFKKFLKYIPYYFKPKNIPEKYIHPELRNINARELYQMLNTTVKNLKEDQLFKKFRNSDEFRKYKINTEQYYINLINRIRQSGSKPISTYFPNEGRLYYSGSTTVRSVWITTRRS